MWCQDLAGLVLGDTVSVSGQVKGMQSKLKLLEVSALWFLHCWVLGATLGARAGKHGSRWHPIFC